MSEGRQENGGSNRAFRGGEQTRREATVAESNLEPTTVLSEAVSCFYTLKAARYEINGLVSRQTDLPS